MGLENFSLGVQAASPVVSGTAGLVGSYLNYKYNKALAEQQNAYNLEMWRLNNEYNSPQAQMQRFKDAGLNPNLIYGQGNSGNSSSAPQMVTPTPPEFSKSLQRISEAFNIENLRTLIANRKKAQAEAKQANTRANMLRDEYNGMQSFGATAFYDPSTGKFGFDSPFKQYINGDSPNPYGFYKMMDYMSRNYRSTELIPYRASLLNWQKNFLVPQVSMAKYQNKYYPYTFWIDRGTKIASGVGDLVGVFNPTKWVLPKRPPITYNNTYKTFYY